MSTTKEKDFESVEGFKIHATTCGTAYQPTLTFDVNMEVTETEAKEIAVDIIEALVWLRQNQ